MIKGWIKEVVSRWVDRDGFRKREYRLIEGDMARQDDLAGRYI